MNQIPNIEETHNTRDKLDEIVLDFNQKFYYEHQQRGLTRLRDDVVGWLRTTLHHQLQKARQDWLREEIVKLEGMKSLVAYSSYSTTGQAREAEKVDQALQTIIDRYLAELDQDR